MATHHQLVSKAIVTSMLNSSTKLISAVASIVMVAKEQSVANVDHIYTQKCLSIYIMLV